MGIFRIFQAKNRRYRRLIEESVAVDDELHGAEKREEIRLAERLGHRQNATEEDTLVADSKDLRLLLHDKFLRLLEEAGLN